jgi:putative OPT family oligopeptide transporter
LVDGVKASLKTVKERSSKGDIPIEEQDMPINYVAIALIALTVPVFLLYFGIIGSIGLAALLTIVMMVFGFLFSAVAAYMAGVIGSSNNPISGVTIATILFTSLFLLALLGTGSGVGAASAIMVGAVVCCAAAIGGDNLQDLKAGHILGATPWKQQVMQIVGTLSAALVLGLVLDILHTAYTIGSPTLSAPQATLMKSVADGVFTGNLPWTFVYIGGVIAVILILLDLRQESKGSDFRVPVLAVAVGIYLPITLTVPIFIGGMINHIGKKAGGSESSEKRGLLMSSGFITGEALMGILVAVPIFLSGQKDWWPQLSGFSVLGPILFLGIIYWLFKAVTKRQINENI